MTAHPLRSTIAFALAVLFALPLQAQVPLTKSQETEARADAPFRRFSAWLEAFNTGKPDSMKQFRQSAFPSMDVDAHLRFRERTGGFTLQSLEQATATTLTGLVQERSSKQLARFSIVVDAAEPHPIISLILSLAAAAPKYAMPAAFLAKDAQLILDADAIKYDDYGNSLGTTPEFTPPDLIRPGTGYVYTECTIAVFSGKLEFPAYSTPARPVNIELQPVNLPNFIIPPPVRRAKSGAGDEFRFEAVLSATYEMVVYSTPTKTEISRRVITLGRERCTNDRNGKPMPPTSGGDIVIPLHVANAAEDTVSIQNLKRRIPQPAVTAFEDGSATTQHLLDIIAAAPDYYDVLIKLGLQYKTDGRREEAIRLLTHALEVNPGSMLARAALGEFRFQDGDFQASAELLAEAARLGSTSTDVYYMLGTSDYKLARIAPAEANLWRALAVDPSNGKVYLQLYNVYMRSNLPQLALQMADTYLGKYPAADDREYVEGMADKLRQKLKP